jgi:hypothetical protein
MRSWRACSSGATTTGRSLQQYVLEEREDGQLIGPGRDAVVRHARRESIWFPRDGRFVKSPLRINGVRSARRIGAKRKRSGSSLEDEREKRRAEREKRETPEQETPSARGAHRRGRSPGARAPALRIGRLLSAIQVRSGATTPCTAATSSRAVTS